MLLLLIATIGVARADVAKLNFKIAAGEGVKTLLEFGNQANLQVLFDYSVVRQVRTTEVNGNYTPAEALTQMLRHTGLTFKFVSDSTVAISGTPVEQKSAAPRANDPTAAAVALEEVVVTAQKREESIRTVPISVAAVTSEDLAARHIETFEDLSRTVPNLSFSSLGGEGLSNLQIRGISSKAGTATVAIYLDDVSLTTRNLYTDGAAEPRIFDLTRLEVLRGPQGTLYGASALGGTIRFVTQQPSLGRFQGEAFVQGAGVSHGGADWDLRGITNIPLIDDRLALRLGVERGVDSGFIHVDPLVPGENPTDRSNRNDWTVGKLAMLFKLTDTATITAAIFHQRYHSADTDVVSLDATRPYAANKGLLEPGTDEISVPSLTVNWDLGFANLTAVTGYYHRDFERINDLTIGNSESLAQGSVTDPNLAAAVFNLKSANFLITKANQLSEEIRLASSPWSAADTVPITWLTGTYFSNERTSVFDSQPVYGLNATFAQFGADPQNPNDLSGGFPNDFTNDLAYLATRLYRTKQYAGFGEATYHLGPAMRLTAGFRYLTAHETFDRLGDYYYSACDPSLNGPGCPAIAHLTSDFHAFTPKFAFGWDVTDSVTVYANITKGFRLGSENRPVPLYGDPNQDPNAPGANSTLADLKRLGLTSVPASFAPDSLWNYEIGTKSLLFERRLALDLSVFYIRWSDIQQTIYLTTSGYDFQANAGTARSYGLELATKSRLTEHITLDASAGYTRATLDNGVTINGVIVNDTFPGQEIPGVPRWSGELAGEYDFRIGTAEAFVRGGASFTGKSHGSLITTDPDHERPSYSTFDASAGMTIARYEFSIFAKNLTDNDKVIQRPNIVNAGLSLGYRLTPRVIGANVRLKF